MSWRDAETIVVGEDIAGERRAGPFGRHLGPMRFERVPSVRAETLTDACDPPSRLPRVGSRVGKRSRLSASRATAVTPERRHQTALLPPVSARVRRHGCGATETSFR